jgi:Ser/Thr protein kinase RdoA (MazF antagonist)
VFVSNPYDRPVLPIGELVDVARTVDDDGSSPLALLAAQAWGYDEVRFLRSSANHVFVCDGAGRTTGVLRFRPDQAGSAEAVRRVAETAGRLASDGVNVAPPMPSADGELAILVQADPKQYVAAMFSAAAGRQFDEESVTPEIARAWGRALAQFHDRATRLLPSPPVPSWIDVVAEAAPAGSEILDDLRRLPTSDELVGVVHGDPELDNVVWDPEGVPTFVDLDDVARSWFAADICFALRDFVDSPVADEFITGYRECRPLTEEELAWLPLFRRAHALATLAGLERILVEPVAGDWPQWATELHSRLEEVAAQLRTTVA